MTGWLGGPAIRFKQLFGTIDRLALLCMISSGTSYVFCDPYDHVITCKGKGQFCGLLKYPVCKDVKSESTPAEAT